MFIHIGDDHIIHSENVVAIIDQNLLSSSSIVEEMIVNLRKNGKVLEPTDESAKSIVITKEYVYFSPLSVLTLKKRSSMISTISKLENYSEAETYEE